MIKENMKETEAASTLLVQVIVLVLMGMFLSMHVLISFVWSGFLSAFLSVEWLPTAMHYLQSWEFARLSVGIPFVIMLFCCIHNYLNLKRSLPDQINPDVMQSIVGSDGRVVEFPNDHPLYVDVLKMSKKAGIRPPRLFACLNSRTVNAWTMPGKNGDNAVLVYSPLLDGMTRSDLRAVIGHELGHIICCHYDKAKINSLALSSLSDKLGKSNTITKAANSDLVSSFMSNKEQEEADIVGSTLMINAGYNPLAMVVVITKHPGSTMDVLKSRPSNADRAMNVFNFLTYQYPSKVKSGYNCNEYKNFLTYANPIVEKRNSNKNKLAKFNKEQKKLQAARDKNMSKYKVSGGQSSWGAVYSFLTEEETKSK